MFCGLGENDKKKRLCSIQRPLFKILWSKFGQILWWENPWTHRSEYMPVVLKSKMALRFLHCLLVTQECAWKVVHYVLSLSFIQGFDVFFPTYFDSSFLGLGHIWPVICSVWTAGFVSARRLYPQVLSLGSLVWYEYCLLHTILLTRLSSGTLWA